MATVLQSKAGNIYKMPAFGCWHSFQICNTFP